MQITFTCSLQGQGEHGHKRKWLAQLVYTSAATGCSGFAHLFIFYFVLKYAHCIHTLAQNSVFSCFNYEHSRT